jgi:hypothetical protein
MSANFFKIKQGLTLDPQAQYGSSDPSPGTDGDIYYNSVLNVFRIFQNGTWQNMGSGSSPTSTGRSGESSISLGATSLTVTFSSALPNSSYIVVVSMVNTTDPTPQYQPLVVTSKTTAGFTVQWNSPTDTANYLIDYQVPGSMSMMGEVLVSMGVTSMTATFSVAFSSTNYSIVAMLQNLTDPTPQYQTVVVTNKTTTGFTATWNAPTDTANYLIDYQAVGYM